MDTKIPLTPKQINSLHDAVENPMHPPAFALTGEVNPNMRIFVVHFDGTENDMSAVKKGSNQTLVADSFETIGNTENTQSRYYSGVGTRTNPIMGLVESVTGMGARERAEKAYSDLCEQTKSWQDKNPDCQVHVHVVGFSRGAGIGVHFMNLVHDRGIQAPGQEVALSDRMMPGKVETSAVLMDAVTTGNSSLKLFLPDSNVATLHVTAGGEERLTFPLTSLKNDDRPDEISLVKNIHVGNESPHDGLLAYSRLKQIELEGARHSDVGGSYQSGDIREVSKFLMCEFQRKLGLDVSSRKPTFEEIEGMHANDSRFLVNKVSDLFKSFEGQLDARQDATRTQKVKGESRWQGDVNIECEIFEGGTSLGFKRHANTCLREETQYVKPAVESSLDNLMMIHSSFKSESGQQISLKDLGKSYNISLRKASDEDDLSSLFHGMVMEGRDVSSFSHDPGSDAMTLHGIKLPAEFSLARLKETLEASDGEAIQIRVKAEKGTPVIDLGHQPCSKEYIEACKQADAKQILQDDPWPMAVRQMLYRLNDPKTSITPQQGTYMLYEAMDSMSHQLSNDQKNFAKMARDKGDFIPGGEIVALRIKSSEFADRHASFSIQAQRADGTVLSKDSMGKNSEEFMMLDRIASMEKAMVKLSDRMHELGRHSMPSIDQQFTPTKGLQDMVPRNDVRSQGHAIEVTQAELPRANYSNDVKDLLSRATSSDPAIEQRLRQFEQQATHESDGTSKIPIKIEQIAGMGAFSLLSVEAKNANQHKMRMH